MPDKGLALTRVKRRPSTPFLDIDVNQAATRSLEIDRRRHSKDRKINDTLPPLPFTASSSSSGLSPSHPIFQSPAFLDILSADTVPSTPLHEESIVDFAGQTDNASLKSVELNEEDPNIISTPLMAAPDRSGEVAERLGALRIVLLVSGINSFTQLVLSRLKERKSRKGEVVIRLFSPNTKCTPNDGISDLISELEQFKTDIILCPFLTAKIPSEVYSKYLTLVVHPGPPGDVGPSALDWTLLGDDGAEADPTKAMLALREGESAIPTRRMWGCIVFQAEEEMDKGPVWAWDEYQLPTEHITKGYLYHFGHSPAAWRAVNAALERVVLTSLEANFDVQKSFTHQDVSIDLRTETHTLNPEIHTFQTEIDTLLTRPAPQPSLSWAGQLAPQPEWAQYPVSKRDHSIIGFSGGILANRPLIKPTDRKIDWESWSANKIQQIIAAFDSQPGTAYTPPTSSTKKLYVYGAHCQYDMPDKSIWAHLGYESWCDIPNGTAVGLRQGAVFFKTRTLDDHAVGIWITHGRLLKPAGAPIEPKIPLKSALIDGGHGEMLSKAIEWPLDFTTFQPGQWQEIYVNSVPHASGTIQYIYWSFYNGAFSTEKCQLLRQVIEWATDDARGKVVAVVLMGGQYFSNGIALNTIEHAAKGANDPQDADRLAGDETWANINAIDDIVELLAGDTASDRSPFLVGKDTLVQKGITTIAVLRGNAAAGGVALAAACDMVLAAENVVLNPAYRAMGLHGSEFHSWSYKERCGDKVAASLLKDMTPMSAKAAVKLGLVDMVLSRSSTTVSFSPSHGPDYELEKKISLSIASGVRLQAAPWCMVKAPESSGVPVTIETISKNKRSYFDDFRGSFTRPPLVFYRNEELSQMLLDCHHPQRSQRYHTRRQAFIRKIKCGKTPSRYVIQKKGMINDEEHSSDFDDVGDWARGREWNEFLAEGSPRSLAWSGWTRIVLYPGQLKFAHLPEGYQYEELLNVVERVCQRIATTCSINPELDYHGLVQEWVEASESSPGAHEEIVTKHIPDPAPTFDNWVRPQLEVLGIVVDATGNLIAGYVTASNSLSSSGSASQLVAPTTPPSALYSPTAETSTVKSTEDDIFPNGTEGLLIPSDKTLTKSTENTLLVDLSTPTIIAPVPIRLPGLPFIISSAPSTDTISVSPSRLPFSREASPAQTDAYAMDTLGYFMLDHISRSQFVIPPPPQSRRWSRLNTGHPDLLVRASNEIAE